MIQIEDSPSAASSQLTFSKRRPPIPTVALAVVVIVLVAVEPASAQNATNQTAGSAFCETNMASTIKNLFSIIQFGGPLIGGVIALGAIVVGPVIRRADAKKELKEVRNQAVIWGIIVAPLGVAIIQFLLTSVVVGGQSCTF